MLFSHGWACLLLSGLFAGLSGWLLRRLVDGAADRPEARRRAQAELDERSQALSRSEALRRDLEADLAVQERHARELTMDLAQRDRYVRELEDRERRGESDDGGEATALRESLRRVGAEREAAERAHGQASQMLAQAQQQLAVCSTELSALQAQAPVLAARAAEARGLELRVEMINRDKVAESATVLLRVAELEALVGELRELESRMRVQLLDRDATIAGLHKRVGELVAATSAPSPDSWKA